MILLKPDVVKKFDALNATWRFSRSATDVTIEVIDKTTLQPYHRVSCPPGDEHVSDAADRAITEAFDKPKPMTPAQIVSQGPLHSRIAELEAELAAVKAAKVEVPPPVFPDTPAPPPAPTENPPDTPPAPATKHGKNK